MHSTLYMEKIRAVLFDLDNTLIDFIAMKQESCKAAAEAMVKAGLQMKNPEAYYCLMDAYFKVGIESNVAFTEFLKKEDQFDHKILAAALNAYLDAKSRCLKPYPNVVAVLEQLQAKGLTLSVVTDAPKTKAYQRLLGMGIEGYFRFVVGYEDTNSTKDTGLPLKLAFKLLKKEIPDISPNEVLMVGDSVKRDIVPAKQLGMKAALSRYGQKVFEAGNPDFELSKIEDLLGLF
ncbi:MAG: HAD hydrolase-like protein [Candidatus Bathyarchaeota archaeon]|nr:HAD hydrolase-like protein [Candidatus Bathyarchaeota archaeon]MDD4326471.1 HAD hydrolase-like protein [Candidatus Bathyarchaeota archaeon]